MRKAQNLLTKKKRMLLKSNTPLGLISFTITRQSFSEIVTDKTGKRIETYETGGKENMFTYGPIAYDNHYPSENALANSWQRDKGDQLRSAEYPFYQQALQLFAGKSQVVHLIIILSEHWKCIMLMRKKVVPSTPIHEKQAMSFSVQSTQPAAIQSWK